MALHSPSPDAPELLREDDYGTKAAVRKVIFSGPRACLSRLGLAACQPCIRQLCLGFSDAFSFL